MFPKRFRTGVKNTTIPNPAILHKDSVTYQGKVEFYDFERQTLNFIQLQAVLAANNRKFHTVSAAHFEGDLHTNHRFVVTTDDNSLLWHKYVGFVAQGGQNHVFVAGRRIKVSNFLQLFPYQQSALLSETESVIRSVFDAEVLRRLDEAGTLWN